MILVKFESYAASFCLAACDAAINVTRFTAIYQ